MGRCQYLVRRTTFIYGAAGAGCPLIGQQITGLVNCLTLATDQACADYVEPRTLDIILGPGSACPGLVGIRDEVVQFKWFPCGQCCFGPPSCTNVDTLPEAEACYAQLVAGVCGAVVRCCPHVGASYGPGCYNAESTSCCQQAGDTPGLFGVCPTDGTDPCIRGCCCIGGCVDVQASAQCPAGCLGVNDGKNCGATADPCHGGCCLCQQCCNISASSCAAQGGTSMPTLCGTGNTNTNCRNARVHPPCKKADFRLSKRPTHAGFIGAVVPRTPRTVLDIGSTARQRTIDENPQTSAAECKVIYGFLARTNGAMEGRICNTWNRNCAAPNVVNSQSTRRTQRLGLVRSGSGAFEFRGNYRPPCPEASSSGFGCLSNVGCPTV